MAGVNTLGYTENQPALAINPSISLSDSDHTRLASATVKISANFSTAQDLLEFFGNAMTGNIVGNYNLRTGVLSLISEGATATPAQFEAALRRVTYRNLSDAPTTLTRSISFQASDGITLSNIVIGTITITPVNDAPILSGANAIAYATSQAATAINPTILVADIDNTTQSTATVRIATNYVAGEDLLAFTGTTATGNITGSFDSGTGTMTLTSVGSTATKAQFQAALRLITYRNTSLHPALAARTVEYQISDGFLLSNRVTCLVTIKVAGAAPVLSGGSTLSYKEKQPAKIVNSAITVADSDSASLAWATVKLSSGFAAGQDVLDFAGDATTGNITGSYNASTGILL
ncbi:MAG: sulfurtransferase, partial [Planctomycetota bacterium]|nr:sulfurtransferase [Planctomycetota bacterium]